ncbi:MAG: phosphoribosylanthranilate isomerase [bacterium]
MMKGIKVKICGITNVEDMNLVADAGADCAGVLFELPSPRSVPAGKAVELSRSAKLPVFLLLFDAALDRALEIIGLVEPAALQLQGNESPDFVKDLKRSFEGKVWKAVHLPADGSEGVDTKKVLDDMGLYIEAGADGFVLDSVVSIPGGKQMGGTGKVHDWNASREIVESVDRPVFLAGGLRPENAHQAVYAVRPFGVDVSSGVESSVGKKSAAKVNAFIKKARMC